MQQTVARPQMITVDTIKTNRTIAQRPAEHVSHETDEEIVERLRTRFAILDDMTRAVKKGDVRAMIVSGPPGVGKSHGVETVLSRYDVFANVAQDETLKKYTIAKGNISALCLYQMLWDYKDKKCIVVFDDCDSVLFDDIALNLLKAALDTGRKRTISWHTESRILKDAGIPNSFDFEGGCIFITNVKFDHVKSKKLQDHLEALESRCHYLDLTIDTEREKMLRIKQIVSDGMLDKYEFQEDEAEEIINYIDTHRKKMRELSLRMVLKVADLRKAMPTNWEAVASVTCMRPHR
jgi:replicative DNA helicase